MGRIAGIYHFDLRPVSGEDEAWLCNTLGSNARLWKSQGLLMGEGAPVGQPSAGSVTVSGSICTWEGRLHNRRDLASRLGIRNPSANDAELTLKLFEAGGA